MSIAARVVASLLVAIPLAARAESPAETATALQTSVRAWMADLAGPSVDFGTHQVTVTADDDAYRFEMPVAGPVGNTGWTIAGNPVTVRARPLEGDRWSIESLTLPSPVHAAPEPATGRPERGWALDIASQHTSGVFDPTLATPSSLDAVIEGYSWANQTADGTQISHIEHDAWHGGWAPLGDGRVTLTTESHGSGMSLDADLPRGKGRLTMSAANFGSSARVDRIAFDRLGVAIRSLAGLIPNAAAAANAVDKAPHKLSPEEQAGLHSFVEALSDLLGGTEQHGMLQQVKFDINGSGGTVDRLEASSHADAPGGMLDASFRLALEGIATPLVPEGPLSELLPRRVVVAPHVSGVPANDFIALLLRAIDASDFAMIPAEAAELLGKGPLRLGFDELSFDLGQARLQATGVATIAAPNNITGTARITATGLEALIRRANTVPELRRAAPFLILAKGMGEQQGDTTVWNIAYADGHATVNGTDLKGLMPRPPAPGPGGRPPGRRPNGPAR